MSKLKKLFFGIEMTWWRVIAFAAVCGVYTGIVMQIPALDNTSIQNFGVGYEGWFFVALIVIMNCKTPKEAALKTLVFFLISQPLVYITMLPKYSGVFPWNYYRFWFIVTLLTLPGGYIAWQVKKQNVLGALILSVACGFLSLCTVGWLSRVIRIGGVPYGLITALWCIGQVVIYISVLLEHKRERLITGGISVLCAAVMLGITLFASPHSSTNYLLDDAGAYSFSSADESIVEVCPTDSGFDITAKGYGTTTVTAEKSDGGETVFEVTVEGNGVITVTKLEK